MQTRFPLATRHHVATAKDGGVILHTAVTIGYDIPWRRIHELLIAAAKNTDGILEEPGPFVHQTSLDDSFVSYELNAYTESPNAMARIRFQVNGHAGSIRHATRPMAGMVPVMPTAS
jgi:small-conductance mechanosensitive channel